ncbi:MAG: hypothetical protein FWF70_00790 [Bacteroidetes bacterium]|nr:hypothetical protein [Bacteroidota bacterium]MCL1969766.1 hypothetical protein [Bacteroidota bacterium]
MNKTISFFLGLLLGILICLLLFYFDIKIFKSKGPDCNEKKVITHVQKDTVFVEQVPKPVKQYTENKVTENDIDETVENEPSEEDVSSYEPEFSLEGIEQEEVFSDRLLQTKTVKVRALAQGKQEVKLPDDFFQYFEIQQWSTLIKNKITYYRDKSMVKLKGIDINNVNVVFWNDAYFLEIGNRFYTIPETQYFEKLNLIQIPQ